MPAPAEFVRPPVEISAAIETDNFRAAATPKVVPELNDYPFSSTNPSLEARCGAFRWGVFLPEKSIHPDDLRYLSGEEFQLLVDSRPFDGPLQRAYARSLRAAVRGPVPGNAYAPLLDDDATIRDYDLRAVRGRDWKTATFLAAMYLRVDKVESYAWWRIVQEMGHSRGRLPNEAGWRGWIPSDQEIRDGTVRADELINELELLSGLGVPEECLTTDEIVEERSHLAALVRRLAQRAVASEAPAGPPRAFNRLNGHSLVVENVCSSNCPTDLQRVIYYQDVPDVDACSLIDGVEQTIQAQVPGGRYEERTFCVPALLVDAPGL